MRLLFKTFFIIIFIFFTFFTFLNFRCENINNDDDKIIIYPVPFNPHSQLLKIRYNDTPIPVVDKVVINIYDINGDDVFNGEFDSLDNPIIWNGRNNSGKITDAGEYNIKITATNSQTGYYYSCLINFIIY